MIRRAWLGSYLLLIRLLRASGLHLGRRMPFLLRLHRRLLKTTQPAHPVLALDGIRLRVHNLEEGIGLALVEAGAYEPFTCELLVDRLARGECFVDVGANIGYFSLLASRVVGKDGTVAAFEPVPEMAGLLQENLAANGYGNVDVITAAVSDIDGDAVIYNDRTRSGWHSGTQANVTPGATAIATPTVRLDSYVQRHHLCPRVIKVDIEGGEGAFVRGAQVALARCSYLFIEFWPVGLRAAGDDPPGLLHELVRLGFDVQLIDEADRCLRSWRVDEILTACDSIGGPRGAAVNLLCTRTPQDDFAEPE